MAGEATEQTQIEVGQQLKKVVAKLTESNATAKTAVNIAASHAEGQAGPEPPHGKEHGWWGKLLGHNDWMKKEAQRASKLAKLGLGKVADFGKAATKKIEGFAKNILDLLMKGLGLAALWWLFKWMSEADWEGIVKSAKEWIDKVITAWAAAEKVVEGMWSALLTISAWFYLKSVINRLKTIFAKGGRLHNLWKFLKLWTFTKWFGKGSFIRSVINDLKIMFGKNSTIGKLVKHLKDATWKKWFGFPSPLRSLLRFIKSGFGVGSLITKAKELVKVFSAKTALQLFGKTSPIMLMLAEMKTIFGKESKLALRLAEMKKGAHVTLFGPNSIIGKFRAFFTAPIDKKLSAKHHTKMMGTSPAVQLYQRIKNFFGPVTRPLMGIIADFKKTSTFAVLFGPQSGLMRMLGWVRVMFGLGGTGGFTEAIKKILENPAVQKIVKGLGTIGKRALAILGPVSWLIAAYDAIAGEGGFMDKFQKEEGSLWAKVVAGLSGAMQNLIKFFFVDMIGLVADSVQWLMKKILVIFGYDEKEIEKSDWYKFSLGDYLGEVLNDFFLILEGWWTLDPKKMWKGLSGLFGKGGDLMSWIINKTVIAPLNWIAKFLFGEDAWQADEIDISKWFTENVVDPIFAAFKKIWDIDWGAALIGILPEWAVKIAKKTGLIDDRTPEQIAKEEAQDKKDQAKWDKDMKEEGLVGAIGNKLTGWFSSDDKIKKVIPKLEKTDMGGYGNYATNVQNVDAKQSHATSVVMASSADNPAKKKHQLSRFASSDIRLKENIQLIEEGKDDNPNIYSFNYRGDKNTKWKGVMAQELIGTKYSDAVITDAEGFYMVDYTRLGFPMVKISE